MNRTILHLKASNPSCSPVTLDHKTHTYKHENGQTYTSVTTMLHHFFAPFDEKEVSKTLAKIRKYQGIKTSAKKIRAEWQVSRDMGTEVHKQIEAYILDSSVPESSQAQFAASLMSQLVGEKLPELLLWSDKYKIAGTCDLVIRNDDGTVSLIDWKTNKEIRTEAYKGARGTHELTAHIPDCNYWHYVLQLNLYATIIEEETGLVVRDMTLVHLMPTSYKTFNIPREKELSVSVLQAWQKNYQKKKNKHGSPKEKVGQRT